MKIKNDFTLRNIAGNWVALPLGDAVVDFTGMITLNESGVLLWRALEKGACREELISALLSEYEVSEERAASDADAFIDRLRSAGCLEE